MRSFPRAALLIVGVFSGAVNAAPVVEQPAADAPAVVGEAYSIDGATVTPADAPFDDVGLAVLSPEAGTGSSITMAHRTLPLPSYVEVTELDSGRTILVRVERRGPLEGSAFVSLSAGAFAQIGADPAQPLGVRVRRVSPQEYERSLLRTGQRAPERLATPKSLLEVLRSRLASKVVTPKPVVRVIEGVPVKPSSPPSAAKPTVKPVVANAATVAPKPPAAKPDVRTPGAFTVQIGAFARRAGADITAKKLGGDVTAAGKLWRVRLGPFATRAEASAAQAKARKAGFADAQVIAAKASPAK